MANNKLAKFGVVAGAAALIGGTIALISKSKKKNDEVDPEEHDEVEEEETEDGDSDE